MSDEQDRQREREEDWQRKREAIRDRANRGEITGKQADAAAKKLGGDPLSTCELEKRWRQKPAKCPAKFRPDLMPYWTLTMALVWILYRDLNEVREWYVPYLAKCLRWVSCGAGWVLKRPPVPTLLRLRTTEGSGPKASMSVGEAEEQLLAVLQKGSLKASGIDPTTGLHVEIPALEWLELVPVLREVRNYPGKGDEVRPGSGGKGYPDVRVPSAGVRSCFPAQGETRNGLPGRPMLAPDAKASSRRGRKKGDGSHEKLDEPLILRGMEMVNTGLSADAAAKKLAGEAYGINSTLESKVTRLANRIRRRRRTVT